jgi:hypothetical protein
MDLDNFVTRLKKKNTLEKENAFAIESFHIERQSIPTSHPRQVLHFRQDQTL